MYQNTFHFVGAAGKTIEELGALAGVVKAFYDVEGDGQGNKLTFFMSQFALGPGRTVKIYDLADFKPRAPHYTETTLVEVDSLGSTSLPLEVAVCLSYEALHISGGNVKRRRGRIYLGPFSEAVLHDGASNLAQTVKDTFAVDATAAATNLMGAALALGFTWGVYSPTNNTIATLARVWVDNAFDTVRGRGNKPSARVTEEGAPFQVTP